MIGKGRGGAAVPDASRQTKGEADVAVLAEPSTTVGGSGVAGLKPTFGRVPLTGHFPRCGSLEDGRTVIGPIAGTVADLAATLEVIAGPDGMDGGTPPVPLGDPGAVRVAGCG